MGVFSHFLCAPWYLMFSRLASTDQRLEKQQQLQYEEEEEKEKTALLTDAEKRWYPGATISGFIRLSSCVGP